MIFPVAFPLPELLIGAIHSPGGRLLRLEHSLEEPRIMARAKKKTTAVKKAPTKSQILSTIADECDLTRRDVSAVFESLNKQIGRNLKRGPGMFTIPGLIKIEKKRVPARKARKGVPNPFRPGELMDIAAKPASTKVKVRALKGLKEMV